MSPPDVTSLRDGPHDEAAAWHVRLASDAADEADWLAFEAWLGASDAHRKAYADVEALWQDLDDIAPAAAAPAEAEDGAANVTPFRPRKTVRPPVWLGALAASLVAAVLLVLTFAARPPTPETYRTAFAERRVVVLSDGSRISLNGNSVVTAALGRRERRVVMGDGEVAFDIAKDSSRPFIIQAGEREVRVVGTEFNILNHAGETHVTVRRGIVEVRPTGASDGPPLARLTRGQALVHRPGAAADQVAAVDPAKAFAWTEGRLVFDGETLAEAAVTLNRYVRTPIDVAPDARALRVKATLVVTDEDQLLRSLAAFLPVQIERRADSVRLSLRHASR